MNIQNSKEIHFFVFIIPSFPLIEILFLLAAIKPILL